MRGNNEVHIIYKSNYFLTFCNLFSHCLCNCVKFGTSRTTEGGRTRGVVLVEGVSMLCTSFRGGLITRTGRRLCGGGVDVDITKLIAI